MRACCAVSELIEEPRIFAPKFAIAVIVLSRQKMPNTPYYQIPEQEVCLNELSGL
jgi:hypothetical protein